MNVLIKFKDPVDAIRVNNLQIIKANDDIEQIEIKDFKDFILDPSFRYAFIGDSIATFHGNQIHYLIFE